MEITGDDQTNNNRSVYPLVHAMMFLWQTPVHFEDIYRLPYWNRYFLYNAPSRRIVILQTNKPGKLPDLGAQFYYFPEIIYSCTKTIFILPNSVLLRHELVTLKRFAGSKFAWWKIVSWNPFFLSTISDQSAKRNSTFDSCFQCDISVYCIFWLAKYLSMNWSSNVQFVFSLELFSFFFVNLERKTKCDL